MDSSGTTTISALSIAPVVDALRALGYDADAVLERARLRMQDLSEGARLARDRELEFWEATDALCPGPELSLKIAAQLRPGALGGYEYLLRNSETLKQLIERAAHYIPLVDELTRFDLKCEQGVATLRLWRPGGYPMPATGIECSFTVAVDAVRAAWPGSAPRQVRYRHACKGDPSAYRKAYGCSVLFGCTHNEILFDEGLLDLPARGVDARLGRVREAHNAHLLAQLPEPGDFVGRARQVLLTLLEAGQARPDALARALGVAERTLRRRLSEQQTSYQELLDGLRRELALARVQHTDASFEQIADELGFSDASAFYRAFRRWSGTTPARFRRDAATGTGG